MEELTKLIKDCLDKGYVICLIAPDKDPNYVWVGWKRKDDETVQHQKKIKIT